MFKKTLPDLVKKNFRRLNRTSDVLALNYSTAETILCAFITFVIKITFKSRRSLNGIVLN